MILSRRALAALTAVSLVLGGCGEAGFGGPTPQPGVWLNIYDKNDRIEILSPSRAKVTALLGQGIDAWTKTTPAQSDFGQQIQDAEKALARYEQIEVSYVVDAKNDLVTFTSDVRGSRTLGWNGSDMMDDKNWSMRAYLRQK